MIKANELRVGNLILLGGKHIAKIARIDSEQNTITTENTYNRTVGGMTGDNIYLPSGFATAIPLTPEWLERCGFRWESVPDENDIEHNRYEALWGEIDVCMPENDILEVEGFRIPHIKYLHQLQNLYFVLTDEELTTNHEYLQTTS